MAALPAVVDPTLEAADRALEELSQRDQPRSYLGMSSVGAECERRLWYDLRWVSRVRHDALSLKRFADGHHGEDVQADRLRLVDGVTLLTIDPDSGKQWRFEDMGGHFAGHMDGAILGLIQAPKTWHVWEHKQVGEKKQNQLIKLKAELGEKDALAAWDATYYAQAVLYLHYSGMERHYLTCSTPGGRSTVSCRTNANAAAAIRLIEKARRIIFAPRPPARISNDPGYYLCRWCDHSDVCHEGKLPERSCRTCLSSSPLDEGGWHCARWNAPLDIDRQKAGCPSFLTHPDLVAGEQIDADPAGNWIEYRAGERTWRECVEHDCPF